MSTIVAPTVETPTVNLVPSRKSRKNNGAVNTSAPTKAELIGQFDEAWNAWLAGKAGVNAAKDTLSNRQTGLVGITARLAGSGLFKSEELIELVKSRAEKAGMTPQSASHALIACGLRQRAKRSDAGKDKGPKTPTNPITPPASMAATPAASAPVLPATPGELAKALVAKLGKEAAIAFVKSAYTELALG